MRSWHRATDCRGIAEVGQLALGIPDIRAAGTAARLCGQPGDSGAPAGLAGSCRTPQHPAGLARGAWLPQCIDRWRTDAVLADLPHYHQRVPAELFHRLPEAVVRPDERD